MSSSTTGSVQHGEAGFSLLEILIALMILSIGLVAVFLMFGQAISMQGTSVNRLEASRLAESIFSEIQYRVRENGTLPDEQKNKTHSGFADRYRYSVTYPNGKGGGSDQIGTTLLITIHWQKKGQRTDIHFLTVLHGT